MLGWRWGGRGWFEGDPGKAPESEPASLRVVIRKTTDDKRYPIGIASDKTYPIKQLSKAGIKPAQIQSGLETCEDPVWRERLQVVVNTLQH